jgi:hypothetical protein
METSLRLPPKTNALAVFLPAERGRHAPDARILAGLFLLRAARDDGAERRVPGVLHAGHDALLRDPARADTA